MKQFKQLLSLVLSVALALSLVLIPQGGVTQASAVGEQTGSGSTIHPFSGTDALIRDTIEELQALGKTAEATKEDKALAARVERASGLSYAEVRSALYGALTADFSASQIDVSELGLSEQLLSQALESVLRDNYMSGAFTGLTYTTEGGKVTRVDYTVSEGYAAAMDAYSNEVLDVDMSGLTVDAPEAVQENAGQSSVFGGSKGYATYDNEEGGDGEETAECKNHTVGGKNVGDYNLDGEINVGDVAKFRSMVLSEDESCTDFNEDGEINVGDVAKFRNMVLSEELAIGDPEVTFTWNKEPVKDQSPITDGDGNVLNGGLLYDHETGEVSQGILPNVYYTLKSVSFDCSVCGAHVVITDETEDGKAALEQMCSAKDIYVDVTSDPTNPTTKAVDAGTDPGFSEEEKDNWLLYTEMEVAVYTDDTFEVGPVLGPDGTPITGEDGNPVYAPAMDEDGNVIGLYSANMDNGAAEVSYFYSILSSFINDKAAYFGTPTDFWTSKNTENNPMAALKYVCNVDPETQVPPAQMTMMVRDLPQAFMAYYWQYGDVLVAMRDAAIEAMPEGLTDVQQQLFLHDWLCENAWFDMGAMTAKDENGNPASSDPIQMTTFGALLSNQLRESYDANGDGTAEGYYGALCPGYAAAYNLLVQAANPDVYQTTETVTDEDGNETTQTRWATVAEVDERGGDLVDFVQVLFYTDTAETSIAGEGFGGGWFNNVHYFSAVKLASPDENSEGADEDGYAWYYVDACYDDIYIECMQQYRGESDGSVNHTYFLLSPQTCADLYGDNVEVIDSLYDGYVYVDSGKVYQPGDDKYNEDDPNHPIYDKVATDDEFEYDDTSYEDSWFSGAVSKIYWDDEYFYYVDGGASAASYADMMNQIDSGDSSQGEGMSMDGMIHGSRVNVEEQDLLKRRLISDPDFWPDEEEDDSETSMFSSKEDTYAEVLFDYGTGEIYDRSGAEPTVTAQLADEVVEDFVFNEQYPALTHSLGLYKDMLYFNLGNDIYWCKTNGKGLSLFKEYNTVNATSDGRLFTATSYTLDENGTDLSVTNHPIGALCVRTAYEPQYTPYDNNGQTVYVFTGMNQVNMLTVNIATNYSFTSAGTDVEPEDRYSVEAVNFNPDYQLYGEKQEGENDNAEFMWCAVIRDEIKIDDMVTTGGGSTVDVPATCTRPAYTDKRTESGVITNRDPVPDSEPTGHNYVYDETEGVYLCETCKLHATVKLEKTENGTATLYSVSSNGMEGFEGGSYAEDVTPVSTEREAESKNTGDVEIICTPEVGYRVAKVEYKYEGAEAEVPDEGEDVTEAAEGETPVENDGYTEILPKVVADEDGNDKTQYILTKEEGCVSIRVTFEEIGNIVTVEAENGEITLKDLTPNEDGTYEVVKGTEVTLEVKADDGYIAEEPEVTYLPAATEEGETPTAQPVTLTANEDGTYTFTMPDGAVTVKGVFSKLYAVTLERDENSTLAAEPDVSGGVKAGETVTLTVDAATGYTAGKPEVKTVGEDSKAIDVTPVEGQDGVYTFEMPAADVTVTVTATKDAAPHSITVNAEPATAGTAKADPETAVADTKITVTVSPANGYEVDTVKLGEEILTASAENTYTFTMPDADVTVTVTFKEKVPETKSFKVTVGENDDGEVKAMVGTSLTIEEGKTEELQEGTTVVIIADPGTNKKVDKVLINGEALSAEDGTYTFTVKEDTTITVTFVDDGTATPDPKPED